MAPGLGQRPNRLPNHDSCSALLCSALLGAALRGEGGAQRGVAWPGPPFYMNEWRVVVRAAPRPSLGSPAHQRTETRNTIRDQWKRKSSYHSAIWPPPAGLAAGKTGLFGTEVNVNIMVGVHLDNSPSNFRRQCDVIARNHTNRKWRHLSDALGLGVF